MKGTVGQATSVRSHSQLGDYLPTQLFQSNQSSNSNVVDVEEESVA